LNPKQDETKQFEAQLNILGKMGWMLHEYSAAPVKTGVDDGNGQPVLALEMSFIMYRTIDEGKIKLNIAPETGVKNAVKTKQ
jgi:hypothetical protein